MSENKAEKSADKAGKILGIIAIVIVACIILGFISLLLFGEKIAKWLLPSAFEKEVYTEFTQSLKSKLSNEYYLCVPDSAILTEGENTPSWDVSLMKLSFTVPKDDFDRLINEDVWKKKDGPNCRDAVFTLMTGRKSGAELHVYYGDPDSVVYRCSLKDLWLKKS